MAVYPANGAEFCISVITWAFGHKRVYTPRILPRQHRDQRDRHLSGCGREPKKAPDRGKCFCIVESRDDSSCESVASFGVSSARPRYAVR